MKRREKGSYGLLDNPVMTYAKTHHDASTGVLIALAERDNYTHLPAALKIPEVMLETGLGQRAVEKCLTRLEAAGLAVREANGWAYSGANCRANRHANKQTNGEANGLTNDGANERANDGSLNQSENAVQDDVSDIPKEVEGIGRNINTPLPPTTLPAAAGESQENGITPSQQLTPDAAGNPTSPANVPEVQPSPVMSGRAENHKLPVDPASALLALWNDHRAALPRAELTDKRARALGQVVDILGEHAPTRWAHAVREVAQDPYWRKKKYGLDNLLAGQKYVAKAEAWAQRHPEAQLLPQASASPPPEAPALLELTVPEGPSPFPRSSSEIDWDNVRPPTGRYAHLARYNPAAPLPPELQ